MLARPRPNLAWCTGVAALLSQLMACGGGDPPQPPPVPAAIEGPYALVMGPGVTVIPLGKALIVCRSKPALKEFELSATFNGDADAGKYLRFTLKDYSGPRDYRIEYAPAGAQHKVEVGFPSGTGSKFYAYKFFEETRVDLNETYRSRCDFSFQSEELLDRTRYKGTVTCGALWADFDSLDYVADPLNGFADLVARFECEQPS